MKLIEEHLDDCKIILEQNEVKNNIYHLVFINNNYREKSLK